MSADLVLRGGRVFAAAPHRPFCEALAIQGGRVVAAGNTTEVQELIGPRTRVVELRGRLALPGFHDAHTHTLGAGLMADELSLEGASSPEECAERVAERARERPGEWVLGRGWDADRFSGGAWPHRKVLDAKAPGTPVFLLRRDGHAAWASGRALEIAGIGAGTGDPAHGKILREAGEPTGVLLEEAAIALVRRAVPAPSLERRVRACAKGLALAREHGITHLQDDASYDGRLAPAEAYGALLARGELTARVTLWQRLGRPLEEIREERAKLPPHHGVPRLAYGLLKGFLDGSLGSRTALLEEPYHDEPSAGSGIPLLEPDELAVLAREAHAAGFQIGLHAIGDRAVAIALDAFAALRSPDDGGARLRAARHRIEHAQVFRPGDVARLGVLGVVASVQPVHLANDMKIARGRLGEERCRTSYPWRSLLDSGAAVAFGTDYPVESIDPLRGVYCAVARRSPDDREGTAFHAEQLLTREEALLAYTAGSAFASHQERVLGRLAPGFQGDVAVLSRDLFAIPHEAIPDVRCDLTVLDGEVVFER